MPQNESDVSVVVCAYTEKRWDELVACVASVQRQVVSPREIIVVIDHNPGLLERATTYLTGVLVIENRGAPGASSARNSGVGMAQGSLIAFLDDDTVAEPDWLEQLIKGYDNPRVLGVGGTLEPVWQGGRPRWFPSEFDWVVGCSYKGLPAEASPVRNLIAANMSVRREVVESIGGFRSGYGNVKVGQPTRAFLFRSCAGDEETEFCIQALRRWPHGIWLYLPPARVHHKVPQARASWKYFLKRCYDEGFGKARLSRLVGATHGLSAERTYTLRTLPGGIVRGIRDACRGDWTGLARASAMVAGLIITTSGYLIGAVATRLMNHDAADGDLSLAREMLKQ